MKVDIVVSCPNCGHPWYQAKRADEAATRRMFAMRVQHGTCENCRLLLVPDVTSEGVAVEAREFPNASEREAFALGDRIGRQGAKRVRHLLGALRGRHVCRFTPWEPPPPPKRRRRKAAKKAKRS